MYFSREIPKQEQCLRQFSSPHINFHYPDKLQGSMILDSFKWAIKGHHRWPFFLLNKTEQIFLILKLRLDKFWQKPA